MHVMDGASDAPDARMTRMLRLLGLGVRSRGAVVGVERVREAVGRGTLRLAVVAPDASHHSLHKVRPLLAARGVPVLEAPSAVVLGQAVGRDTTVVVGVTDVHLARGIQQGFGVARDATDASDGGRAGTVSGRAAHVGRPRRDFRRVD
ncbi:hypothetical protein tb265_27570 [Gemmatimonadetes bacterium T265]|nr:hypothetical protein tb265_27570 [Gemmatimonadetes bacterium T265]